MQMGSRKTAAVINVTPMIDILLVLLVTFMLLPGNRQKNRLLTRAALKRAT
jgi:biopolymer transport protein ExbD